MEKLRNEFVNFRDKIYCCEISSSQMKELSDRLKAQLKLCGSSFNSNNSTDNFNNREEFSIILLFNEMLQHNLSIYQGAAPSINIVFDLSLSPAQLRCLTLCVQNLQNVQEILTALDLLITLLCRDSLDNIKGFYQQHENPLLSSHSKQLDIVTIQKPHQPPWFFAKCKTLCDVLFHYKRILPLKNREFQLRCIDQLGLLVDYSRTNHSTLIADHIKSHEIHKLVEALELHKDTEISQKAKIFMNSLMMQTSS